MNKHQKHSVVVHLIQRLNCLKDTEGGGVYLNEAGEWMAVLGRCTSAVVMKTLITDQGDEDGLVDIVR